MRLIGRYDRTGKAAAVDIVLLKLALLLSPATRSQLPQTQLARVAIDLSSLAAASPRRFRAEITFAVNADADGAGFHVAFSDYKHGVHFHLLGALDFAVDLFGGGVELGADFVCAKFVENPA